MTGSHAQVRTYGGWRRSRSIGLLGLGPVATLVMLGCFAALILVAAFSLQAFVYVAPPAVLAGAVSVIRAGGGPVAQLAVQRGRGAAGADLGRGHGVKRRCCHAKPRGAIENRAGKAIPGDGIGAHAVIGSPGVEALCLRGR